MEDPAAFDRDTPDNARADDTRVKERLAIRCERRIVIVTIASIVRLEASDNLVIVYADRPYRHHETLTDLCARLRVGNALRVHRSHAVNVAAVRELEPRPHGEYELLLRDGSVVRSGRHFRTQIEAAFGLLRAPCAA